MHKGHFQVPCRSMWDGGKGWEEAVHMPSCVTYVAKKHLMFVKRTPTYLVVNIIRFVESRVFY